MTYIQRQNGNLINLDQLGIRTRDFIVNAPSYNHETEVIEGADGQIDMGSTRGPLSITVLFRFVADDWIEFGEKRDDIYNLFESEESFYLIDKRNLSKRWLVKVENSYNIPQKGAMFGDFEVSFIVYSGYALSRGTTLQNTTFTHLDIPVIGPSDYRNIRATRFRIYNPGKPIKPQNINDYLRVSMRGQSNSLRISNLTTGDVWEYNGTTNANQTIELNGIRSTKSGLSIFRDTNKKLISLAHGWNTFEITGSPNATRRAVQANMPRRKMSEAERPNPFTFEFIFKL